MGLRASVTFRMESFNVGSPQAYLSVLCRATFSIRLLELDLLTIRKAMEKQRFGEDTGSSSSMPMAMRGIPSLSRIHRPSRMPLSETTLLDIPEQARLKLNFRSA